MRGYLRGIVAAIALIGSLVPMSALADSQTFNAIFFRPATGRNPYLMLQSTETLEQLQFNVGEIFSYGYRPLDIRQGGTRVRGVIDQLMVADFVAAMGALDWLQFGIDFPLIIMNRFQDPLVTPAPGLSNEFDIGDLRFEAKARVLDTCKYRVGLALVPFVTVPTGKDAHYVGDPGLTGGMRVALDGKVSKYVDLTLNIGYQGGKKVVVRNIDYQHRLLLGGGVLGHLKHGIDLFAEINAFAAFNKLFHDRDMNPVEAMAGMRWDIKETGVSVHAGAGSCLVCGVMGARARGVLGVKYRLMTPKLKQAVRARAQACGAVFGKGFSDEEIYYLQENCPPDPSDYQPGVNDEACPKYYELREVADLVIRCPESPEQFNPKYHDQACPKVFTLAENYSQDEIWSIYTLAASEMGIRCPPDPAQYNPTLHDVGCPKYYDLREVVGLAERCPSNPADFQSGVHDAACPKFYTLRDEYDEEQWALIEKLSKLDSDNDRINDYLDRCRETPEDYNGFADDDGCPDGGMVAITGGEVKTVRPVTFAFGSAELEPAAQQTIDLVIGAINKTPWVRTVRVGGNTDSIGSPEANRKLSLKRAEAVIQYMRTHGLRSGVRLIPIAYGANRPVASNDTEEGRRLNRRVIFNIPGERYPAYDAAAVQQAMTPPAPTGEMRPEPTPVSSPYEEPDEPVVVPPSRWEH